VTTSALPNGRGAGIAGTTIAHATLIALALVAAHHGAPSNKIIYEVKLVAAPLPTRGPATPVTTPPPPEKHAPAPVKHTPVKAPAPKPPPVVKHAAEPVPTARTPVAPLPNVAPSTGSDVVTMQQEGTKFQFPEYLTKIVNEVYRRWNQSGMRPGMRARIAFVIMRDGTVPDSSIRVETTSRNSVFDNNGMQAIEAAGAQHAFGPLPSGYNSASLPVLFNFTMIPKGSP
jgi:outer membrane biosynthesis protein TonB